MARTTRDMGVSRRGWWTTLVLIRTHRGRALTWGWLGGREAHPEIHAAVPQPLQPVAQPITAGVIKPVRGLVQQNQIPGGGWISDIKGDEMRPVDGVVCPLEGRRTHANKKQRSPPSISQTAKFYHDSTTRVSPSVQDDSE